ncbi:glycosyltransferase family 2 protein [Puniceibacterium sediminis]|uniref:Glycosyl transferase family 2 n=1 Tax=Puniceibacterium sediminis TaxID=1608407 RepID=A0A238YXV5_9RHOB|nr:glycosyltransferase family 2 protein [Puniceibacterium sediminis]SNR75463.1 Glycosyl transferase family 2 [Puniceibacterium sediminis]
MFRKPTLPEYDIQDVGSLISQVFGDVDPEKLSAFVPVKNELPLLPAFLAHYRRLGFEQFLVFDDRSNDGTFEYLRKQKDCVVIHTAMTFGEELIYTGETHKNSRVQRFGTFAKMAIPPYFMNGKFVAYFDADEFLILPPGVTHIREVYDRIEEIGSSGALATMVEFFPRSTAEFKKPLPHSFDGLMDAYGWFEAEPLFDPMAEMDGRGKPIFVNPSKSMRLFEHYGVQPSIIRETLREKIYLSSKEKKNQEFNRSARHKTPILKRTDDSFLFTCHDAITPPKGEILLTLAHFVFTSNFARKIQNARKWKAHVKGAAKYRYYQELLDRMSDVEDGFLTDRSQRYENPQQLIDAGLMRW